MDMENSLILTENNRLFLKEIIKILAFFDLFAYPLTSFEIWEKLNKKLSLAAVTEMINIRPEIIGQKNGFYFLSGRGETVTTRQKRYNYSNRKLKVARNFARIFGLLPFVRAVALANSIGTCNLRDESDIDFFIITSPGRIWLTRFFCAGLAKLLDCRPTLVSKRDKICLSFYISTAHLNLDDLRLPSADPYFDYWLPGLVLLYNKRGTYEQFLVANNLGTEGRVACRESKTVFGDYSERLVRKWQLKIMPAVLKEQMNRSSGVVVGDTVLKLYAVDRRAEFLKKFNYKTHALLEKIN